MKKLYEKNEVNFALVWVVLYVLMMNIALRFCGGFDGLESKTASQMIVPLCCALLIAVLSTVWIARNGLTEKYGLCRFKGNPKAFLWFVPLIAMSCINLRNGLALTTPLAVTLLMMAVKCLAAYVEELVFRGFLFRAMAKTNLKSAVIVSAVTFGAGHIVNLLNTAGTLSVLLQVCYAIVIGFLYTVIVLRGGSLWPCVASHMFINGSSLFGREQGAFSALLTALFGRVTPDLQRICGSLLLIVIAGGYALWLWKKTE